MIYILAQATSLEITNPDLVKSIMVGFATLVSTVVGGFLTAIRYLEKARVKSDDKHREMSDKFADTVVKINGDNHDMIDRLREGLSTAHKECQIIQADKTQNLTDSINELRVEMGKK